MHPTLFPVLRKTLELIGVWDAEAQKRVVIMTLVDKDKEDAAKIGSEWMRLNDFITKGPKDAEVKFDSQNSDETALLCYSSGM